MKRCTRCVTPDTFPGLTFDADGVCAFCRRFEERWGPWIRSPERQAASRRELDALVARARKNRRGRYDVLVPLSGGKDSLNVLRILRRDYGLEALAYTYDNAFLNPVAEGNSVRACERLGVDRRFDRHAVQPELVRHFLCKSGNICGACVIPMLLGAHRVARREGIWLIAFGISRRTDPFLPRGMNPWYFRNVVEDGLGLERVRPIWGKSPVFDYGFDTALDRVKVVNVPDFVMWDEALVGRELADELGAELGGEHSDCLAYETAAWLARERWGFSYPTLKMSMLIRHGFLAREDALARLEALEDRTPPASLAAFAERIGLARDDVLAAGAVSADRYYEGIWNRIATFHRNWFLGR